MSMTQHMATAQGTASMADFHSVDGPVRFPMTNDYLFRAVIQACFLDFALFPEHPEFYSTYRMMNVRTHHLYSDKFSLSVVNLKQAKAATEQDRAYQLDQWAAFFKSTEWKEIQMLAQGNDFIQEAAQTMYQLSAEEMIRLQCEAREDHDRVLQGILEKQEKETARADAEKARADAAEAELKRLKEELEAQKQHP